MVEQRRLAGFRPVLADRKPRFSDPGASNLMDLLAGSVQEYVGRSTSRNRRGRMADGA